MTKLEADAAAASTPVQLPYFDTLLSQLDDGAGDIAVAFGQHVHWGYWANPRRATGTASDYAAAAERMTAEICEAAAIRGDQSVLDVGCGFGGTIASIDQRFRGMRLSGPHDGNQVEFVEGTASRLPFADASFDVVLAVEAIFHFPDRPQFFAEAHRVLKPGGKMVVSDFVPTQWIGPAHRLNLALKF